MESSTQKSTGESRRYSPSATEAGSFPSPEQVQRHVVGNSTEARHLLFSTWKHQADGKIPQAFWNWVRDSRMPTVVISRHSQSLLLVGFLGIFCIYAYDVLTNGTLAPRWLGALALPMNLLTFILPIATSRKVRPLFAKYLASHAGLVCPDCGYLLHCLPQKHTCPECGRAYSFASVRAFWLRWMAARKPGNYSSSDATCGK